jgi:class 3 adenylate cyclase/tetratricopeptide (TPR) repeat protein
MVACPSCAVDNPAGQRFCGSCGTALGAPATAAPPEERKIVTALFCDLVGFTATSESADPEDIDRMLGAYFALARTQIEAHGGVVEKFIGDAVLGVFGVPAAHEDDPERAVRAALRICDDAERLETPGGAPLRLRIGINTGEALVRLGVTPGSGERFLAGDAINTASRIQSIAPEMGIAVGLGTYDATKATFEYTELEPASLKGKAGPVRVFHPKAARARLGVDLTRTHDSPFVGREIDLALLKGLFDKTVAASTIQLVTVVGEPGLGKSRIVAELGAYVDSKLDLVTWRQGRCLPYGEGITFWALGEIVKAEAGILESDPPEVATRKLDGVLPEGAERTWFRQRLLPLLGIEASSVAEREEKFTAWRRFIELLAEQSPTVLVFEDIHWADDALLSFLEHVADRAEGVPLLVIGTARPELYERHPDYAARLRNTNRINLDPLSTDETGRLVAALLETTAVPDELARPILERADGNPLYAEEFVRLLRDRDLLVETDGAVSLRAGAQVPLPDSIGALIAARLDTLPVDRKAMLADAAVVGKVFWAGAIATIGDRDLGEVTEALRELTRKELVRPARLSSMAGEAEYAFWHVLARDVAYSQLPRASRASRHVAAAAWIESKAPERVEDLADVLAYHYATATDLARAAGQTERAAELEAPARRFLSLAGERALGLNTAAALAHLERALQLAPPGHPERPEALARFGAAAFQAGRSAEAAAALEEAIALLRAKGDIPATARAMGSLGVVATNLGDPRQWTLPAEALALLESLGPSPELVGALTEVVRAEALQGRLADAVRDAERAIATAAELGLPRPARAVGYLGTARFGLGDPGSLDDFRDAIELAKQAGQGREVALLHNNLGVALWGIEGPAASLGVIREGIAYAMARGLTEILLTLTTGTIDVLVDMGELDEAMKVATEVAPRLQASGDVSDLELVIAVQTRILVMRGQAAQALELVEWLEAIDTELTGRDDVVLRLGSAALARVALGQNDDAAALLAEVARLRGAGELVNTPHLFPAMVRTALEIGDAELAVQLASGIAPRYLYAKHALVAADAALAEAHRDLPTASATYADAADRWERHGVLPEQAFALLGLGRCLLGLGRPTGATPVLQRARAIFERLGAAPALAVTDALLERSSGGSATTP